MGIRTLEWDSEWLGLRVGSVDPGVSLPDEKELKEFDLVYFFRDPSDKKGLSWMARHQMEPIDRRLEYLLELKTSSTSSSVPELYERGEYDEKLIELGETSFEWSRFKRDSRIGDSKFRLLYRQWMEASLNNKLSDFVFVQKDEQEQIAGFAVVKIQEQKSFLVLLAVANAQRKKGCGKALVKKAAAFAISKGAISMSLLTQFENRAARHFFEGLGFQIKSQVNIYHFWTDEHTL